jgi:hypothetical protein
MNRLKEQTQDHGKQPPLVGDFYVVNSRYECYYVSPETAARIGRVLDRRWRPRWLKFVDINGGRIWMRTASVESITESTEAQRSADREFQYARRKEEMSDRRWDDDD